MGARSAERFNRMYIENPSRNLLGGKELVMPRRSDIKKANVILDRDLAALFYNSIKSRRFSEEARIAIRRFVDLYNNSPEYLAQRMESRISSLYAARSRGFSKRFAVEFPKEDLIKLSEALQYLHNRNFQLSRQELIYIALTDLRKG